MTSKTPHADPVVTPELVKEHGLTPEEFEQIKEILGREPNFTELGIFSVMWSEHCSYKNSRKELKKFPTTGAKILVKAGEENAGVVDIGDGWAVAFKIEAIITRARSSLFRARPQVLAESFETFLRWARARSFA